MAGPYIPQDGVVPTISPKYPALVDAHQVSGWINRLNSALPHFEKVANNGALWILEKEIQNITALLVEGQEIASSTALLTPVIEMIDRLAKPRLLQLQQVYTQAQGKITANPGLKKGDEKLAAKWKKLGLPPSVLEYHVDCARFLIESKLAFAIVGYKQTSGDSALHDLKLDVDGHPMIRMQGRYTRWEAISRELQFDAGIDKIKTRGQSGGSIQTWNYFHPQGLVPLDRFNYDAVYPIHQLSQDEYDRLLAHSKKFFDTNPEVDGGIPKDCIVQVFTSPRRQGIPEHPLLENLHKNIPVHVGIRLITADRQVYSFGYQMPFEEQAFVLSDIFSQYAMTARCKVSMLDYEELRSHEGRLVTSVPISTHRSQNILGFLNELNTKELRFQFIRQNCTVLMQDVLQRAGYFIPTRTTAGAVLWGLLPDLNQFPIIGGAVARIEKCASRIWDSLPQWLASSYKLTRDVLFYIPEKFGTILVNIGIWKIGAAKKTFPLQAGTEEEELTDKPGIQNFSSVIRSWTDIFKDQTSAVAHPKFLIDWQREQNSTFVEPSSDLPKLAIVPPVA